MKILVSSKALQKALSVIDFGSEYIIQIHLINSDQIMLSTNIQTAFLRVSVLEAVSCLERQKNVRWDHIFKLVSAAEDQPVTLNIGEKCTSVIFQY